MAEAEGKLVSGSGRASAGSPDGIDDRTLDLAVEAIERADALVITAGAGMGVDSGLPDFRGTDGFWRAYPPIAQLGLRFEQIANPVHFSQDPPLAWGFYGHRLNLYRETTPHRGYGILCRWARRLGSGAFVFTSNVDGHFQKAGFAETAVVECHGSLGYLQCNRPCTTAIWSSEEIDVLVDEGTFRALDPLPSCPFCGGVARPNVLMFGDWLWVPDRTASQESRFRTWLDDAEGEVVVLELGAGTAVPTVRLTSEHVARSFGARLIRVNPREHKVPDRAIALPTTALAALEAIDARLGWGEAPPRG